MAVLLDSAIGVGKDIHEWAKAMLATIASSDDARPNQVQEVGAVVPQLCHTLNSGSSAASIEHTSTALLPRQAYCQPCHLVIEGTLLPDDDHGGT